MKKTIRNLALIILALSLLLAAVPLSVFASSEFTLVGDILSNEFIEMSVDPMNSRYTLGTTGGNPLSSTDDYKLLLYGHPGSGTTYTTVVVDGNAYQYGNEGFTQNPTFDTNNGSSISVAEYNNGNIRVKQTLQIIMNNSTNRKDVVEIKYEVTNMDSVAHTTGSRIMFDTMLGGNDSAPFRIPGIGEVTTQTEYSGASIPQYWQAFDSLTDPTVIGQGSFLRTSNRPDTVQFTNWRQVYDTPWDCPVNVGVSNGDSAVCVIWNEKTLSAGETVVYRTHYGISEFVEDANNELSLSVYGDSTVNIENNQYTPNPISATAYIKNIGNQDAINAYVTIDTSGALSVNGGYYNRVELGTLIPGQEVQISWDLLVGFVLTDTNVPIVVKLGAEGIEEITVTKIITIPAIEGAEYSTITFDTAGGSIIAPILGFAGSPVTAPVNPTRVGYIFAGWSPALPAFFPQVNITVTAQWTPATAPRVAITLNGVEICDDFKVQVPWCNSYCTATLQLGYVTNIENAARVEFTSDNENVKICQTGKVTNVGIGCRSTNITVKVYDEDGNVLATDTVKITFYKNIFDLLFGWTMVVASAAVKVFNVILMLFNSL